MANMLATFKKISPKGRGIEMLMINKTGKEKIQRYAALSKAAANRAENMKCGYIEILINEKNKVLGLKLTTEPGEYGTKITKTHRIAAEGAWKRLESMGIELKEKYILEWMGDVSCWTAKL